MALCQRHADFLRCRGFKLPQNVHHQMFEIAQRFSCTEHAYSLQAKNSVAKCCSATKCSVCRNTCKEICRETRFASSRSVYCRCPLQIQTVSERRRREQTCKW